MKVTKYKNGDLLKDVITGFEGVVMVVCNYATGCTHYGLLSRKLNKDGQESEWQYIDQSRLKLVQSECAFFDIPENTVSGPCSNPPKQ